MKTQLMILLTMIGVFSSGCTEVAATSSITPTVTRTIEPFLPSPSPSSTLTPLPTLTAEEAYSRLLELIQNNAGCSLPCLWGITPGLSTTAEARDVLLPYTGIAELSVLPITDGGGISLQYPIDDSHINLDLDYIPSSGSQTINAIYLKTQAFHNGGDPAQDRSYYGSELYAEKLNLFTLHTILSTYGVPSEVLVFIEPSLPKYFNLRILYPENGIFLSYGTFVEEQGANYLGCPSKMFVSLYLLSPESSNNYQEVLPTIGPDFYNVYPISDFKPLGEAVNLSLDEFYQKFKDPTGICLETPKAIWWP